MISQLDTYCHFELTRFYTQPPPLRLYLLMSDHRNFVLIDDLGPSSRYTSSSSASSSSSSSSAASSSFISRPPYVPYTSSFSSSSSASSTSSLLFQAHFPPSLCETPSSYPALSDPPSSFLECTNKDQVDTFVSETLKKLVFVEQNPYFLCGVCKETAKYPTIHSCGQLFCERCFSSSSSCVSCANYIRSDEKKIHPVAIRDALDKELVHCPFEQTFHCCCSPPPQSQMILQVRFGDFSNHMLKQITYPCPYCQEMISLSVQLTHWYEGECKKVPVICSFKKQFLTMFSSSHFRPSFQGLKAIQRWSQQYFSKLGIKDCEFVGTEGEEQLHLETCHFAHLFGMVKLLDRVPVAFYPQDPGKACHKMNNKEELMTIDEYKLFSNNFTKWDFCKGNRTEFERCLSGMSSYVRSGRNLIVDVEVYQNDWHQGEVIRNKPFPLIKIRIINFRITSALVIETDIYDPKVQPRFTHTKDIDCF
jgi:hypothetical protein